MDCARQTFREQVPGVLERYQRRTVRLNGQVSDTVRELAGGAGSRLLSALGIDVSRYIALRTLLAIRLPGLEVPRVLGIDLSGVALGPSVTSVSVALACPEMKALNSLIGSFAALLVPGPENEEKLQQWITSQGSAFIPGRAC